MKVALVLISLVLLSVTVVFGGGGGDQPPCAAVASRFQEVTKSMLGKMKRFHQNCIQYNDDERFLGKLVETVMRASKRLLSRANRMCKKKNNLKFSSKTACEDYMEVTVEEMVDLQTNHATANFTPTRNSSMGCQPGMTWFNPTFANGSEVDMELLVRQHPKIQPCNNITQSITLIDEKIPRHLSKPSKLAFNVTFSEMCRDRMSRNVTMKRIQCRLPSATIYQVPGLKDVCPKRSMCEPAEFMLEKADQLTSLANRLSP